MLSSKRYCKQLSQLLAGILRISESNERWVTDICLDSRDVSDGALFIALQGHQKDGREYIAQAWKSGAVVVIQQGDAVAIQERLEGLLITMPDIREQLATLTNRFWDYPSEQLTLVGITGTNGKTSISHYCAQLADLLGGKAAVIGTLGYGTMNEMYRTDNTTPDNVTLQRRMAEFRDSNIRYVFMEVSSHGLEQQRVAGLQFDFAVFANLSRDHLDYHGDMQSYAESKRRLFEFESLRGLIINGDDPFGQTLIDNYHMRLPVYSTSVDDGIELGQTHQLIAKDVALSNQGFSCNIQFDGVSYPCMSRLYGRFNISNILNAAATMIALGFQPAVVFEKVSQIQAVSGRMQAFSGESAPTVIVDYAHTPDALQKVLQSLHVHCRGRIVCVFGCGGDRDPGKRSMMGDIASRYADQVILTNDNPRSESPERIIENIKQGIQHSCEIVVEFDRAKAIGLAIEMAQMDDVVLVAGKGHENYQIMADGTCYFSDMECVAEILSVDQDKRDSE